MYALVSGGYVLQIEAAEFPVNPAFVWVDVTTVSPPPQAGWTYAGGTFTAPTAPPSPVVTTIASEDFISRFTAAEQQAIVMAAQTSWQINLWLTKAVAAMSVDVTDARTIAGMAALVAASILTSDRVTQILDLAVASP